MVNQKYPAKAHAFRTAETLKKLVKAKENTGEDISAESYRNSLIYLNSSSLEYRPYSDIAVPFRQDRYFYYLTGAEDIEGGHVTYDIRAKKLTLYLPPVDDDDVMWSGMPISLQEALEKYDVDEVKYSTDLGKVFEEFNGKVLSIQKSFEFSIVTENSLIHEALDETRMIKDEFELSLMRQASKITDNSHLAVMSALPIEKNEGHIHAEFVYHTMRQGSKIQAYDPICCSGTHCGTLHYVKNDSPLDDKLLVLIDAGAEWKTYASDVTRVFPINGHWTKESRDIYDTVLDMQTQALEALKPGVDWDDMHLLTHKILINSFLKLGIFHNGTAEEILDARVSVAFYPHGLGHMLGMEVHDVGGRANYSDPDPMFRYLRIRRKLEENMMVTVEPGCYFNDFLLAPILNDSEKAKYVNQDVLKKYMPVGGVRIEDDVLITKDGHENFTKITKDADEISKIVLKGISKGREGFHVVV